MQRFPESGKALDVGCGHGLLIQLLARDPLRGGLQLHGIDHDAAKIDAARRSMPAGAEFSTRRLDSFAAAVFDVVSLVDVLYTVRREVWNEILSGCFRVLRPGGRLIVKEVVDRPRWKFWAIMAQEALSVRVLRITKGDRPHFEPAESYRRAMLAAGFSIREEQPLAAGWISHYLLVGVRR
jgi:2-polyprenyl-3-methyl-5-hydroxy-6-metoxy-1,4-benzoquinol methylase